MANKKETTATATATATDRIKKGDSVNHRVRQAFVTIMAEWTSTEEMNPDTLDKYIPLYEEMPKVTNLDPKVEVETVKQKMAKLQAQVLTPNADVAKIFEEVGKLTQRQKYLDWKIAKASEDAKADKGK